MRALPKGVPERGLSYEVGRADLALTPRGAIAGQGGMIKLIFQRDDRSSSAFIASARSRPKSSA